MTCKKCGYSEKKEIKLFGSSLCKICATFAPDKISDFQDYISDKIDWKYLETFRKNGIIPGQKQKKGMVRMASIGRVMARPALGYDVENGNLILNEDSIKVRQIYKTFLNSNDSLNSLSKSFSLSVPGLKKILSNRTYLGEIKFDGKIFKGDHKQLINTEIFYAVQRKLKTYSRPRK